MRKEPASCRDAPFSSKTLIRDGAFRRNATDYAQTLLQIENAYGICQIGQDIQIGWIGLTIQTGYTGWMTG